MPDFLLDTNVVVDHLRGEVVTAEFLLQLNRRGLIACSVLTQAEIYAGVRDDEEDMTHEFFSGIELIHVTPSIAERGGRYRNKWAGSHGTGLVDGLLAATAVENEMTLVTADVGHFPMSELLLVRSARADSPAEVIRGSRDLLD